MHNGGIADFHKMKRKLQQSVQEDVFNWVTGNTGPYREYQREPPSHRLQIPNGHLRCICRRRVELRSDSIEGIDLPRPTP